MRTLASLLAAAAIAAFGLAGTAMADKPDKKVNHGHFTSGFSAPFVANGGGEVSHSDNQGSKGDVDNDGNWGVITGALGNETLVDVCFTAIGVAPFLLVATMSEPNGDLLIDNIGDVLAPVPSANYQAPSMQIYADGTGDCGTGGTPGALLQESGTTVVIDAD